MHMKVVSESKAGFLPDETVVNVTAKDKEPR